MNKLLILAICFAGCQTRTWWQKDCCEPTTPCTNANLDALDKARIEQRSPETLRRYYENKKMRITDIISLSQAGISNDKIIGIICETSSRYDLCNEQILDLKEAGVSQRLIDYMINFT